MNTFVLFITMCGQLIYVSAKGIDGSVSGTPDWISMNPPAVELYKELTKDPESMDTLVQDMSQVLHMECKGA